MILQNLDTAPPVMTVNFFTQAVLCPRGPRAVRRGAWALRRGHQEIDVKYLQNVLLLTDHQLVPVTFRLRPLLMPSVRRHLTRGNFHSAVRSGDQSCQKLAVQSHLPMHCRPTASSSDIPDRSVPGCRFMALYFATFSTSPYQ